MKQNKKISLLYVIILIILLFISEWVVYSIGINNQSNSSSINSVTVNINGFDDFTKGEVNALITDEKRTNELIFDYDGISSEKLTGWYYLSLDDYGNCTDFEFSVSLDLNYSTSTKFGRIKLIFGGYYNSQNQFVSYDILPITHNEKSLLMVGIEDLIVDGGYMIEEDFLNDSVGSGMGWFDDDDRDRNFRFVVDREGEGLEYEYFIDNVGGGGTVGTKSWIKSSITSYL